MAPTQTLAAKKFAKNSLTMWAFGEWVKATETMPADSDEDLNEQIARAQQLPDIAPLLAVAVCEEPIEEDPLPVAEEKEKKIYVPKRMTEAPSETSVVCDWADNTQCFCRAWTPAHTMTSGAIKDRKLTCGGRCKKSAKSEEHSLRALCFKLGEQCEEMAFGEDYEMKMKIETLYSESADFYKNYPKWFNEVMEAKYGTCEKEDSYGTDDWADYVRCCPQHFTALTEKGRTMGFPKEWGGSWNGKGESHHPIITGFIKDRCEGKEHIVFNEQGFVWEDPSAMIFSNWKGGSTSADMRAKNDKKWVENPDTSFAMVPNSSEIRWGLAILPECQPNERGEWSFSRKCWRVKNLCDRKEIPDMLVGKWQEEGWDYLGK